MSFRAIVFLLAISLITALFQAVPQADAAEARPALMIPSPRHDAGSHWEGESVTHTFEMSNTGSAELKILNVRPG
jgi:hypothetical protein